MQFPTGINCDQTIFSTLDDQAEAGTPVWLMEALVDKLYLAKPKVVSLRFACSSPAGASGQTYGQQRRT
jgi:hypothetical protein